MHVSVCTCVYVYVYVCVCMCGCVGGGGGGGTGVPINPSLAIEQLEGSLLHPLHDADIEGEHPQTEYQLVLQLEGDATVQNVQDSGAEERYM